MNLAPLSRFRGVKRRQEVLVERPELTVIEDFGHHPTALKETLISFRNRFPGKRITAVFEPRSNTARTNVLQQGFMDALSHADRVYLGAINRADKLRADERFDSDAVSTYLTRKGISMVLAPTNLELLARLQEETAVQGHVPQLVVFFSNGSFDGIISRFADSVR